MQLTRYTDYGLRTLIFLALLPEGQKASIDQISDTYGISRNNVNKVVHQLGKANIIHTKRGKGGGFSLHRKPEHINLGELVTLLENTLQVVDCNTPPCRISPVCRLQQILAEATQAFIQCLKAYHLQDLIESKQASLIQLLDLEEVSSHLKKIE
jgi:Rrf2 family nitric oxide-sensitive transcriptional repressor